MKRKEEAFPGLSLHDGAVFTLPEQLHDAGAGQQTSATLAHIYGAPAGATSARRDGPVA